MRRKMISAVLAACVLFTCLPWMIQADETIAPANNGSITLADKTAYVISASGTVSNYAIALPYGSAKLTINGNLTIDDSANGKSAISVSAGALLTLVVNGTLTVKGGRAVDGQNANLTSLTGGAGGFAGISVPAESRLRIMGTGTLNATGGDAGRGGHANSTNIDRGGAGAGGAGAGIGGNGGRGGNGAGHAVTPQVGGDGVVCGNICVLGTVTINAYGGAGGTGGNGGSDAGGAGGYPAAGIGGGGAGGGGSSNGPGGGGYSGGAGCPGAGGTNGQAAPVAATYANGGGYFTAGYGTGKTIGGKIGGGYANSNGLSGCTVSNNGGVGGTGGNLAVSSSAAVRAYNGNQFTDGAANHVMTASNAASFQTPIYAQLGYALDSVRSAGVTAIPAVTLATGVTGRNAAAVNTALAGKVTASGASAYGLGIGSGAGFTEGNNGAYLGEATRPGEPKVMATANNTLAVFGWTKPAYNGNLALSGYQIDVYDDADGCFLVTSVKHNSANIPSNKEGAVTIAGLTAGQTYYVTVSALFGNAPGMSSNSAGQTVFSVSASPDSGNYYKNVTVTLTSVGVAAAGGTTVYSTNGSSWNAYPSGGLTFAYTTNLFYGVRISDGTVSQIGEREYCISKLPFNFSDLTIHKYTNGAAAGDTLTATDISGMTGQVCAKLTNFQCFTNTGGLIVVGVYDRNNRMERLSVTTITSASGSTVVSKPVTLPDNLTAGHSIRAFVITGFADMTPVGKIAKAG